MARRPVPIKVKSKDRTQILEILSGGIQQVRVVLGGLVLRQLAEGFTAPQVAQTFPLTSKAIRQIAHRYNRSGLQAALYDKPRPGAQEVLDGSQKQRIVAMVCSQAPEGRARWTVRLIVEEAVRRKLVPKVGRETIRILLQSHELKPWRGKNVVYRRTDPGVRRKPGRRVGHLGETLRSRPASGLLG
ncbi:MAG: helix-turn-helix domain-containing protein [Blastocatellia bacterium]